MPGEQPEPTPCSGVFPWSQDAPENAHKPELYASGYREDATAIGVGEQSEWGVCTRLASSGGNQGLTYKSWLNEFIQKKVLTAEQVKGEGPSSACLNFCVKVYKSLHSDLLSKCSQGHPHGEGPEDNSTGPDGAAVHGATLPKLDLQRARERARTVDIWFASHDRPQPDGRVLQPPEQLLEQPLPAAVASAVDYLHEHGSDIQCAAVMLRHLCQSANSNENEARTALTSGVLDVLRTRFTSLLTAMRARPVAGWLASHAVGQPVKAPQDSVAKDNLGDTMAVCNAWSWHVALVCMLTCYDMVDAGQLRSGLLQHITQGPPRCPATALTLLLPLLQAIHSHACIAQHPLAAYLAALQHLLSCAAAEFEPSEPASPGPEGLPPTPKPPNTPSDTPPVRRSQVDIRKLTSILRQGAQPHLSLQQQAAVSVVAEVVRMMVGAVGAVPMGFVSGQGASVALQVSGNQELLAAADALQPGQNLAPMALASAQAVQRQFKETASAAAQRKNWHLRAVEALERSFPDASAAVQALAQLSADAGFFCSDPSRDPITFVCDWACCPHARAQDSGDKVDGAEDAEDVHGQDADDAVRAAFAVRVLVEMVHEGGATGAGTETLSAERAGSDLARSSEGGAAYSDSLVHGWPAVPTPAQALEALQEGAEGLQDVLQSWMLWSDVIDDQSAPTSASARAAALFLASLSQARLWTLDTLIHSCMVEGFAGKNGVNDPLARRFKWLLELFGPQLALLHASVVVKPAQLRGATQSMSPQDSPHARGSSISAQPTPPGACLSDCSRPTSRIQTSCVATSNSSVDTAIPKVCTWWAAHSRQGRTPCVASLLAAQTMTEMRKRPWESSGDGSGKVATPPPRKRGRSREASEEAGVPPPPDTPGASDMEAEVFTAGTFQVLPLGRCVEQAAAALMKRLRFPLRETALQPCISSCRRLRPWQQHILGVFVQEQLRVLAPPALAPVVSAAFQVCLQDTAQSPATTPQTGSCGASPAAADGPLRELRQIEVDREAFQTEADDPQVHSWIVRVVAVLRILLADHLAAALVAALLIQTLEQLQYNGMLALMLTLACAFRRMLAATALLPGVLDALLEAAVNEHCPDGLRHELAWAAVQLQGTAHVAGQGAAQQGESVPGLLRRLGSPASPGTRALADMVESLQKLPSAIATCEENLPAICPSDLMGHSAAQGAKRTGPEADAVKAIVGKLQAAPAVPSQWMVPSLLQELKAQVNVLGTRSGADPPLRTASKLLLLAHLHHSETRTKAGDNSSNPSFCRALAVLLDALQRYSVGVEVEPDAADGDLPASLRLSAGILASCCSVLRMDRKVRRRDGVAEFACGCVAHGLLHLPHVVAICSSAFAHGRQVGVAGTILEAVFAAGPAVLAAEQVILESLQRSAPRDALARLLDPERGNSILVQSLTGLRSSATQAAETFGRLLSTTNARLCLLDVALQSSQDSVRESEAGLHWALWRSLMSARVCGVKQYKADDVCSELCAELTEAMGKATLRSHAHLAAACRTALQFAVGQHKPDGRQSTAQTPTPAATPGERRARPFDKIPSAVATRFGHAFTTSLLCNPSTASVLAEAALVLGEGVVRAAFEALGKGLDGKVLKWGADAGSDASLVALLRQQLPADMQERISQCEGHPGPLPLQEVFVDTYLQLLGSLSSQMWKERAEMLVRQVRDIAERFVDAADAGAHAGAVRETWGPHGAPPGRQAGSTAPDVHSLVAALWLRLEILMPLMPIVYNDKGRRSELAQSLVTLLGGFHAALTRETATGSNGRNGRRAGPTRWPPTAVSVPDRLLLLLHTLLSDQWASWMTCHNVRGKPQPAGELADLTALLRVVHETPMPAALRLAVNGCLPHDSPDALQAAAQLVKTRCRAAS